MDIIERIDQTLIERGKIAADMCKQTGISSSTMSTWRKNRNDPPARHLEKIATYLGVSLDYLITGSEAEAVRYTSPIEDDLIELFRELPERKQYEFIGELKGFLKAAKEQEKYLDEQKRSLV